VVPAAIFVCRCPGVSAWKVVRPLCLCVSGGAVREGSGEGGWFETVYGGVLVCSLNPKPETRNPWVCLRWYVGVCLSIAAEEMPKLQSVVVVFWWKRCVCVVMKAWCVWCDDVMQELQQLCICVRMCHCLCPTFAAYSSLFATSRYMSTTYRYMLATYRYMFVT
jgi:hypothetical protein